MRKSDFKILATDDDDIVRDMLVSLLVSEGYSVLSARDGLEAIRLVRMEDVHLVLTDYRMPGADGIEVLQHAIRHKPEMAVIILTAYATLDAVLKAVREGAFGYLTKPFKIREVVFAVDRAYRQTVLLNDNRELVRHLRDTYQDMELLAAVAAGGSPEVITGWMERIERLRAKHVLTTAEAGILRRRLANGTEGQSGLPGVGR